MPSLDPVSLLARLVAVDSTSDRPNGPLLDLLETALDRPGVRCLRLPTDRPGKANLLVVLGPEPQGDGAGLVLCGHSDTVPAGEGWSGDPFILRETGDGHLVARGAADMKGFLALATALAVETDPASLLAPLCLLVTADEEIGTLGAAHFAATWPLTERPLPRAVVVGEPTELAAIRLHKGHLKLAVELTGRSAHSGYPHLGRNAIEAMGAVLAGIDALRRELESERLPASAHFAEVPFPALNLGRIQGGTAINVVAERCRLELGIRLLPAMTAPPLVERVRSVVATAVSDAAPGITFEIEVLSSTPPMECPAAAPLHRALCHLLGQTASRSAMYASDAGPLAAMGLDTVLFGPGSISVAHRPDEHIARSELTRAAGVLTRLVHRFCQDRPVA